MPDVLRGFEQSLRIDKLVLLEQYICCFRIQILFIVYHNVESIELVGRAVVDTTLNKFCFIVFRNGEVRIATRQNFSENSYSIDMKTDLQDQRTMQESCFCIFLR